VASYSAGRDIAAESEPSTGTKLDIAATDQIRPSATTIPTINARICIPLALSFADNGSHIFSSPRCEVVHRCAKFFETKDEEAKRNCRAALLADAAPRSLQCPAKPLAGRWPLESRAGLPRGLGGGARAALGGLP
jgi:hypothetical protein